MVKYSNEGCPLAVPSYGEEKLTSGPTSALELDIM